MLPEIGSGVARENQRRSPSWASLTTVGGATRPIASPSGVLRRRSGWLRSSRPLRSSFAAGCMLARARSVHVISEGRQRLLPIPRGARKYPAAEHLQAAHQPAVVSDTRTPQSACTQKVGGSHSVVRPVDTAPESPTPLSSSSLLRHSSFIRAVCVNALVRICAGGDQRWSSLLRQSDGGRNRYRHLGIPSRWLALRWFYKPRQEIGIDPRGGHASYVRYIVSSCK